MKFYLLILLTFVCIEFSAQASSHKKFNKEMKEILKDYDNFEGEEAAEELGNIFPRFEQMSSTSNSENQIKNEFESTANSYFSKNQKLRTFGIEEKLQNNIEVPKETVLTFRKPLYFFPDGSLSLERNPQGLDKNIEPNLLETSSGNSNEMKNKDIDFNSNQIEFTGHYRKAIVLNEEEKKNVNLSVVDDILFSKSNNHNTTNSINLSTLSTDIEKLIHSTNFNNHTEVIEKINKNFNKTKLIHSRLISNSSVNPVDSVKTVNPVKAVNTINLANPVKTVMPINSKNSNEINPKIDNSTDNFFSNEVEIDNLSTKISNLIKNILLDIVDSRKPSQDYKEIIEKRNLTIQNLVKSSLKNLRKQIEKSPQENSKVIKVNKQMINKFNVTNISETLKSKNINTINVKNKYGLMPVKKTKNVMKYTNPSFTNHSNTNFIHLIQNTHRLNKTVAKNLVKFITSNNKSIDNKVIEKILNINKLDDNPFAAAVSKVNRTLHINVTSTNKLTRIKNKIEMELPNMKDINKLKKNDLSVLIKKIDNIVSNINRTLIFDNIKKVEVSKNKSSSIHHKRMEINKNLTVKNLTASFVASPGHNVNLIHTKRKPGSFSEKSSFSQPIFLQKSEIKNINNKKLINTTTINKINNLKKNIFENKKQNLITEIEKRILSFIPHVNSNNKTKNKILAPIKVLKNNEKELAKQNVIKTKPVTVTKNENNVESLIKESTDILKKKLSNENTEVKQSSTVNKKNKLDVDDSSVISEILKNFAHKLLKNKHKQ